MVVLVVVCVWGAASVAASLAVGSVVACADRSRGPAPLTSCDRARPTAVAARAHLQLVEVS